MPNACKSPEEWVELIRNPVKHTDSDNPFNFVWGDDGIDPDTMHRFIEAVQQDVLDTFADANKELRRRLVEIRSEASACLVRRPNHGEWMDSMQTIYKMSQGNDPTQEQKDFPVGPDGEHYLTKWEWADAWRRHRGEKEMGPGGV